MSQTLTADEILPLLDKSWWTISYQNPPTNVEASQNTQSQITPATMLYFQDQIGNYHAWQSYGWLDPYESDQLDNYISALMKEAAYELANMGCSGGITNIKPARYQTYPIYFK